MTTEAPSEAERMRRVPGIVFADGPAGRRARIAGTGIEVFEVVWVLRGNDGDWAPVRAWFDQLLDEAQLAAARAYYAAFPAEIDA